MTKLLRWQSMADSVDFSLNHCWPTPKLLCQMRNGPSHAFELNSPRVHVVFYHNALGREHAVVYGDKCYLENSMTFDIRSWNAALCNIDRWHWSACAFATQQCEGSMWVAHGLLHRSCITNAASQINWVHVQCPIRWQSPLCNRRYELPGWCGWLNRGMWQLEIFKIPILAQNWNQLQFFFVWMMLTYCSFFLLIFSQNFRKIFLFCSKLEEKLEVWPFCGCQNFRQETHLCSSWYCS